MMIASGELKTYISGVSGMGLSTGSPLMTGVNIASVRFTVAVWGM
jgi:hypothetical protein